MNQQQYSRNKRFGSNVMGCSSISPAQKKNQERINSFRTEGVTCLTCPSQLSWLPSVSREEHEVMPKWVQHGQKWGFAKCIFPQCTRTYDSAKTPLIDHVYTIFL